MRTEELRKLASALLNAESDFACNAAICDLISFATFGSTEEEAERLSQAQATYNSAAPKHNAQSRRAFIEAVEAVEQEKETERERAYIATFTIYADGCPSHHREKELNATTLTEAIETAEELRDEIEEEEEENSRKHKEIWVDLSELDCVEEE